MKILVTGGAGFIGSEFVRQAKDHEIFVIDSLTYAGDLERIKCVQDHINFSRVDIRDKETLLKVFKDFSPVIVVHFAAQSHVDRSILNPYEFYKTNLIGTHNLLEISLSSGVELFINISTDEVYGERRYNRPFRENDPMNPGSPYAVSKAAADMLGRAFMRTYGLPVITVRPSNNYGPWQYPEKLIPVVIARALMNEPIPVYGTGENTREWTYVSDTVEAIYKIIEHGKPGEIYNVGSGEEFKNIEVVKMILKMLDKSENLITFVRDRAGHDFRYSLNIEKIQKEIGWIARTDFQSGLRQTVDWYLKNINWLNKKVKSVRDYWNLIYNNESYRNGS